MIIPKGHTRHTVKQAIDEVLRELSSRFSFAYYDKDDMYQEGFMLALQAIDKFDPDNAKGCGLKNWIRIFVRSKFLNMRRNKLHRSSPPCSSCKHLIKGAVEHNCGAFENKDDCKKWTGWMIRNASKRSLAEPCDTNKISHAFRNADNKNVAEQVSQKELFEYVSSRIPMILRSDFFRLIDGAKLKKARREAVIECVQDILSGVLNGSEKETWPSK